MSQFFASGGQSTGTTQRDGTGREEGSGWGTRVYLWQIHVDIWQNQYNIVKLKNKIKKIYIYSKREDTLTLLVGMQTSTATMENSVEIPLKTGNRIAL